jgi:hypothetical protein
MINPNPTEEARELKATLLGTGALDPFFRNNTAARKAMGATQLGQALVVEGVEPRKIQTGQEIKYGRETFGATFPCNATVRDVIRRYTPGVGEDSIRENPETLIVYEDFDDPYKTVGILRLKKYEALHTEFGYPLRPNSRALERLAPGANFEKGESLADSIAKMDDGSYGIGTEAQVCFFSLPSTIEDGFLVREGFLKKLTAHRYQTIVGSFGKKSFPLNVHGDANTYKAFPDIGDIIGPDGVVMATRDRDPVLGIADMTPRALREIQHDFDRVLWARAGARIVDVKVYHDERVNPSPTPTGMDRQARKYYEAQCEYYRRILKVYEQLKRDRRGSPRITPEFQQLIVEALIYLPTPLHERKLTRMHKLDTLDEWRVEITYDWPMMVDGGYKLTDFLHGGATRN